MTEHIIEAKGIEKTLGSGAGKVQALRGVDLSLRRGELTLLMGPSGSGKTTLLLISRMHDGAQRRARHRVRRIHHRRGQGSAREDKA